MSGISAGSFVNRDKDRFITMEEYAQLLEACPNQEWRTIIALARIGGLRCPSELKQLQWKDVDWEHNRFLVRSPKTERHAGRGERLVPLFPELRAELEKHGKTTEFVIQKIRGVLCSSFQKIAVRAGLGTIVRPFDNMRMSRSNEVLRIFGHQKESLWIGHTSEVMGKHYFQLTDDDFAEAAG
jgi:integrase